MLHRGRLGASVLRSRPRTPPFGENHKQVMKLGRGGHKQVIVEALSSLSPPKVAKTAPTTNEVFQTRAPVPFPLEEGLALRRMAAKADTDMEVHKGMDAPMIFQRLNEVRLRIQPPPALLLFAGCGAHCRGWDHDRCSRAGAAR